MLATKQFGNVFEQQHGVVCCLRPCPRLSVGVRGMLAVGSMLPIQFSTNLFAVQVRVEVRARIRRATQHTYKLM